MANKVSLSLSTIHSLLFATFVTWPFGRRFVTIPFTQVLSNRRSVL